MLYSLDSAISIVLDAQFFLTSDAVQFCQYQ